MAKMKKYALKEKYVQVPNETAHAVEKRTPEKDQLSLQALGLIVNLWSYNVEEWELHKTELYKRYARNKKTSVTSAWDELVEANYIIEFKYREGKSWEYVYIYRIEPFSEEERKQILAESVEEYGVSSTSDFQQLKINSSFSTVQNQHISNRPEKKKDLKKNNIKERPKDQDPIKEEGHGQSVNYTVDIDGEIFQIESAIAFEIFRNLRGGKYNLPHILCTKLAEEIKKAGTFRADFDLKEVEALYEKHQGLIDDDFKPGWGLREFEVLTNAEFANVIVSLYQNGQPVKSNFRKQIESWFNKKFDFKEADLRKRIKEQNELEGVPY